MHLYITLYQALLCLIFSFNTYTCLTLLTLGCLLQWFYASALITKSNCLSFQHCVYCQKMTPQHYVHCNKCSKCVGIEKIHSLKIGICLTKDNLKRYMFLLHTINLYLCIIIFITSLDRHVFLILLAIHMFVIFWSVKESNIKRVEIY